MNKKAIAILGAIFILIVGTLGFLLYSKYGKNAATSGSGTPQATSTPVTGGTNSASTTPISTSTPTTTGNKIFQLSTDQVISPTMYFDGSAVAYFDNQGNLYQGLLATDSSGSLRIDRKTTLTIQQKANISRILWPVPSSDQNAGDFIAEFNFGGKKTWSYFNGTARTWTDFPPQVESVDWLPGGKKILYVWLDSTGKATINISNPDTTGYQTLADMYETDDALSVSPDGTSVLYYRQFNTDATNAINLTSSDAKLWRGLVKTGYNFGVLWSPDSSKFLFGQKEPSSQKYQLWVYDLNTGSSNSLGVFTTPAKAVWAKDSKTVYAAVPNTGTADDNSLTVDDFYRIDTATFEKTKYPTNGQSIDGRNLFFNLAGDKLLFKNAQDGGLYYLDLK